MVFSKALPFAARLTFQKSVNYGYAQSLVASSHSWNATQNLQNRFQKHQPLSHNAFAQTNAQQKPGKDGQSDFGLVDYLKEYHKREKLGANWRQYQFAKRIEWNPHTLAVESKDAELEGDALVAKSSEVVEEQTRTPVSPQDSAISGLSDNARDEALTKLDEALADVAQEQQKEPGSTETQVVVQTAQYVETSEPILPEALEYAEQLTKLAVTKHYAEIPAVFEAMLNAGITPSATSYNALLAAAIHLPRGKHEAVAKALSVYADMLQRRVLPDINTYTTMIELLSARALTVLSMRTALEDKRARYGGLEEDGKFMFRSSETEHIVLAEDNSLTIALRLFDAAASIYPRGPFSERAFRLLVAACAEQDRIPDMVNVYSLMESQGIIPRADMFVQMLPGFARVGDLTNAVEMYNEYKKLAISHNNGELTLVRKDNDVYAAMVRAFTIAGDEEGATKFMEKLEATSPDQEYFVNLQDTVGLKGLLPEWLKQGSFDKAFTYVNDKLSPAAKDVGFAAVCIRAADRNNIDIATNAFRALSQEADISEPALAMSAMQIRNGNMNSAEEFWKMVENSPITLQFLDMATMHAVALIGSGQADLGLHRLRVTYTILRERYGNELAGHVDESIEVVDHFMRKRGIILPAASSMALVSAMLENHGAVPSVAAHLLAGFGPEDISLLSLTDLQTLMQIQAGVILNSSHDIASGARFAHIMELMVASGVEPAQQTKEVIEKVLARLDRPELFARWNSRHAVREVYTPVYTPYPATPVAVAQPTFEDSYDPYAATTDNKGSVIITDMLERSHGKFSSHMNEALARFKNMRRAGRHPRFFTYAKLISAAAKDNRLPLAQEILALARQDVPYVPHYRIVRFGWVSILDAMIAACLQTGQRHLADQYHQELLSMGAAPSANTFGLYITTLKESTKTFDEASEAVKIFLQAKAEGVEPSSFLYNALIGKLGKARRIDDCLFYFQEMRGLGIRPTSVTYGTIVNALCRVSDEKFAEELFEEMESMPNYKPRPAPYHSMMQFFLTTKRDRSKVLSYYERMRARNIAPTTHTFKLLIDAHASLDPVDMPAAEAVLDQIKSAGLIADAVHYAALIHAKGCVAHDLPAARALFDKVLADRSVRAQPCLYQAIFESLVANHAVRAAPEILADMRARGVELTPYIANALIHGWALKGEISRAEEVFARVPSSKREPSTYEAMTRAYVVADMRDKAMGVVNEALSRGYPAAVAGKIVDLVSGGKIAPSMPMTPVVEAVAVM